MDRALAAREYAGHLTDADLRLLALPDDPLPAADAIRASVGTSFGAAELPAGLRSVTGRKN